MKKYNSLTLISIGALSWIARVASHEIIGHGGVNYFLGGKAKSVSAMYFKAEQVGFSFWQQKLFLASGSIVNIIFGLTSLIVFYQLKNRSNLLGYTLWVFSIMCLLNTGGYISFSRFLSSGMDWSQFLINLNPQWLWYLFELIIGVALIATGSLFTYKGIGEFLEKGSTRIDRYKLLLFPYMASILISVATSFMIPTENRALLVLGAFGNSFFFLISMPIVTAMKSKRVQTGQKDIVIAKNNWIIGSACLISILFIYYLGRGIDF